MLGAFRKRPGQGVLPLGKQERRIGVDRFEISIAEFTGGGDDLRVAPVNLPGSLGLLGGLRVRGGLIGCMVVLAIFLRQRGSPESKAVESPHHENE